MGMVVEEEKGGNKENYEKLGCAGIQAEVLAA